MSEASHLVEQALRCRRLARGINDPATVEKLLQLAETCEARAAELLNKPAPPNQSQ